MFFLLLSFSMQDTQFLTLVSLKKPLNWPKIWNGFFLQNNKIVKRGKFVTGIKIFIGNNLIIFIMFIWYLPIVNVLYSFPFWHIQDNSFCKWCKFCYSILYDTNVTYLTPQNKFLEDLMFQKLVIFLLPSNHDVGKEKLPF